MDNLHKGDNDDNDNDDDDNKVVMMMMIRDVGEKIQTKEN
jgi:hypothetical protein